MQGRTRLPIARALPLRNGLHLSVRMEVALVGDRVTTRHTSIAYKRTADFHTEDWLIRYEYEPAMAAAGDYPYPTAHLHVNATPEGYEGPKPFPDLHLPTRRLSLEEIIRHLIVEHNVPTLGDREEALARLEEQRREFERRRTDAHRGIAAEHARPR